jgi:hypothetical protein
MGTFVTELSDEINDDRLLEVPAVVNPEIDETLDDKLE